MLPKMVTGTSVAKIWNGDAVDNLKKITLYY
jgi:hypothetical protein